MAHVRVPQGAAVFEGHFPDRPIVPGIALLLLVADLAGAFEERADLAPVGLRGVRFRRPVGPGCALVVALADKRFTVRQDGGIAVEGTMELAPAHDTTALRTAPGWSDAAAHPPALPHATPARLTTLVGAGRALACIPARSPLALAGHVPACVVLEAAAQAAQATPGAPETAASGPGLLVRVAEATFPAILLPVETAFEILVAADGEAPPLRRFRASAALCGAPAELSFAVMGARTMVDRSLLEARRQDPRPQSDARPPALRRDG